jgi:hypothetical protein
MEIKRSLPCEGSGGSGTWWPGDEAEGNTAIARAQRQHVGAAALRPYGDAGAEG